MLIAEFLPGDQSPLYASAWAGAGFHTAGGLTPAQKYLQAVTHRHLLKLAFLEPDSGVCIVKSREYLEQAPGENSAGWGKGIYSAFRELSRHEFDSETFTTGWSYSCPVIDPSIHMPYLKRKIEALGGRFIRQKVSALADLYKAFPDSRIFECEWVGL